MNKQSKDGNISWTDYTWNPIRGLCPVDCKLPDGKSYCYARAMYKRFKWDEDLRLRLFERIVPWSIKKPSKIFVCSTMEIFHPEIPKKWRDIIFSTVIEKFPQHTFQILTKMPENIDRPMPDNVHLGVSITGMGDQERMAYLHGIKAKIKFISWEPLLDNPLPLGWRIPRCVDWVIVGKLSGHGKKYDPQLKWIKTIVSYFRQNGKPIYLKNNLKEIWGEKLIQEWPDANL